MRRAGLRIELPAGVWIREVSRAHPDAAFRLLAGARTGSGALELGEVRGPDPRAAAATLREHPDVTEYEQLFLDAERGLARYRVADAALYRFLDRAGIPPEFPVEVAGGAFEIEVTAESDRLAAIREGLGEAGLDHQLTFLARARPDEALLTDRQREVLEAAVRGGYFEVPRESSLGDLAERLDAHPSTVGGVLRRAQARVLDRFLAVPAPGEADRRP